MKIAVLLIGLVTLLLLAGCVQELQANDCGNDIECVKDALEFCKNVKGFQEVQEKPPLEKGRTDIRIKSVSDKNCNISVTFSELVFQKDFIIQQLESSLPPPLTISEDYRNYLQNISSLYVSRLNSIIRENLPVTISCNTGIVDGKVVASDLSECVSSQQNKIIEIFQTALPKIADDLKAEIEKQTREVKEISLKLGEIGEVDYEQGAEKTDFCSGGVSYIRAFVPTGVQIQISGVSFDGFKLNYSISDLENDSFAVVQGLVLFETPSEASAFYQKAYSEFLSTQSSQKISDAFHSSNSTFVKLNAGSAIDSYRFIYQEEKAVVVIDIIPNAMDLSKVVEKLEFISNAFNKRINPNSKQIDLDCNISSTYKEVCKTVQEPEEYQEKECVTRQYKYQATDAKGTYSEGFFGLGCYTTVETTVSNQENIEGAFTFEVTFFDAEQKQIAAMHDSKMITPTFPQTLSINYSYACSTPRPQTYNNKLQAPSAEFCEMVTKTKQVPKEVCGEVEIQELDCD